MTRRTPIASMPVCFLGLALYRAWIDVTFAGDTRLTPGSPNDTVFLFDLTMTLTLVLFSFGASRITPLYARRWARLAFPLSMTTTTVLGVLARLGWMPYEATGMFCAVLGGVGSALAVLLWSEAYSAINPLRTCLFFSLSLLASTGLVWLLHGMSPDRMLTLMLVMPTVSALALRQCHRVYVNDAAEQLPRVAYTFPWKPVAVIALFAAAFGLEWAETQGPASTYSSWGTLTCAGMVALSIFFLSERVDYETVYGSWLPYVAALFLILASLAGLGPSLRHFCAGLGYGAVEIFIMALTASIVYRWSVSAVWLFGISRAVRSFAVFTGRSVASIVAMGGLSKTVVIATLLLVAIGLCASERHLNPTWGMRPRKGRPTNKSDVPKGQGALATVCADLSKSHGLSQRESEVLLLLAQNKPSVEIERDLMIANGTVKAHASRIYRKLGIHSRKELHTVIDKAMGNERPTTAPANTKNPLDESLI